MVVVLPRQTSDVPSMASMSGMSGSTSGMVMGTSTPSASTGSSGGGPHLSPGVIAILAVIGVIILSIFLGFWIHGKIRSHRMKQRGLNSSAGSSRQLASQSTYVGTSTMSTMVGKEGTGTTQPFPRSGLMPKDSELRWAPDRPGHRRASSSNVAPLLPPPHPYLAISAPSQESVPAGVTPAAGAPPPQPNPGYDINNTQPSAEPVISTTVNGPPPLDTPPPQRTIRPLPSINTVVPKPLSAGGSSRGPGSSLGHADGTTSPQQKQQQQQIRPGSAQEPSPRPLPQVPTPHAPQAPLQAPTPDPLRSLSKSFLTFDDGTPDSGSNSFHLDEAETQPLQQERKPHSGKRLMNVIVPYDPELPDELELKLGDVVKLLREFDDGWCVVEYTDRVGKRPGAVPRLCLDERISNPSYDL